MSGLEEVLYNIVVKINEYLSNYILVFLLIGVGLWYTIRTRFVQVRCFGEGMRRTFGNFKLKGFKHDSGMSSFQALATAIAAQVGTGNIVGSSGAILTGGPGAIFWMWIIAFFGMATIYAEATLAVKTRVKTADGSIHGGLVVLIARIRFIPETVGLIFRYAFQPQAIIGGGFGWALKTAITQGAKRGLFSNEAGMGSTPHAHAQANVKDPHEQGVVAMIGVFIDTFIVLTLNALVVISTLYTHDGPLADGYTGSIVDVLNSSNLAQTAFGSVFGESFGAIFVAVCLFFFAFSTILGWNLFGKINVIYLFGQKAAPAYSVIALVFIFVGTLASNSLVWELTDMFNFLMVIPNAIGLFALTSAVLAIANRPHDGRLSDKPVK